MNVHALRRGVAIIAAIATATVGAACSTSSGSEARVASPDPRLTGAEWDYGASIRRDAPGVTYQPDVVIPGGGAASVVGVSGDGITWTLRGDAAEVNNLTPGKLLLVTNRGAGRVLAVDHHPDGNVAVTIGPADLTDFIRDINTQWDGDIDPAVTQIRAAPTLPSSADVTNHNSDTSSADNGGNQDPSAADSKPSNGTGPTGPGTTRSAPPTTSGDDSPTTTTGQTENGAPATGVPPADLDAASGSKPVLASATMPDAALAHAERSDLLQQTQGNPLQDRGVLPPVSKDPLPVVPVVGMTAYPIHASDGSWGVELQYNKNGLRIRGSARIYLDKPRIKFNLDIKDGKIVTAEAELAGVAGVRATFDAGTETGLQANIHQIIDLPLDISIPIFGPLLPFAANFHQSLQIDTVFSAKNSTISFNGDYALSGSLRAGYHDGSFGVGAPSGLSVRKSLLQTTKGVSVGVNGFIIAHKLQMTIGIGGFGFAVGPYVSLITAMSVVNGSDLGIVKCKGGTLNLDMGYGIGYVMPTAVVKVINVFLHALNIGEIKASGGTKPITTHLATLQGYAPKLKICEGAT